MKSFFQKYWVIILVLVVSLSITAVLVFICRNRYGTSFFQNFASNGLATFFGVLIGVPVALWVSNHQLKNTEIEKKVKILVSIRDELNSCQSTLTAIMRNDTLSDLLPASGVIRSRLRTELWDCFKEGGELGWINDVILLAEISKTYSFLKGLIDLSDKIYADFPVSEVIPNHRNHRVFDDYISDLRHAEERIEDTLCKIGEVLQNPSKNLKNTSVWDNLPVTNRKNNS